MSHFGHHGSRDGQPTLSTAQEEADAIRSKAEQDAAWIIRDAEERAELLVKERLAYVEGEVERLRSLRRNIGTLLEGSTSALRLVEHLLPGDSADGASDSQSVPWRVGLSRALGSSYRYAAIIVASMAIAGVFAAAAWWAAPRPARVSAGATPLPNPPAAIGETTARTATPAPVLPAAATSGDSATLTGSSTMTDHSSALTVNLSAERQCWLRATIDGTQVMERLLEADQGLVLQARDRILLRIGDAAALSATINGKPAAGFGGPGEVITRLITLQNHSRWLADLTRHQQTDIPPTAR